MRRIPTLQIFGAWVLDLTIIGLSCWLIFEAIAVMRRGGWMSDHLAFYAFLSIPPLTTVWVPIRLSSRLTELASRDRRRELAVTLLRPISMVVESTRWALLRASVPALLVLFVLTPAMIWRTQPISYSDVLGSIMQFAYVLTFTVGGAATSMEVLLRLCRRKSAIGAANLWLPAVWGVSAGILPIAVIFALIRFADFYPSSEAGLLLLLMCLLGMIAWLELSVQTLSRDYYTVEDV